MLFNYYTDSYGKNFPTYNGLLISNYANGDFEVIHNGKKIFIKNFHYLDNKDGEYILPNGEKRIYVNGNILTV